MQTLFNQGWWWCDPETLGIAAYIPTWAYSCRKHTAKYSPHLLGKNPSNWFKKTHFGQCDPDTCNLTRRERELDCSLFDCLYFSYLLLLNEYYLQDWVKRPFMLLISLKMYHLQYHVDSSNDLLYSGRFAYDGLLKVCLSKLVRQLWLFAKCQFA